MVQTGDPTGTGKGGQSIWGAPFEDELDPKIKVSFFIYVFFIRLFVTQVILGTYLVYPPRKSCLFKNFSL